MSSYTFNCKCIYSPFINNIIYSVTMQAFFYKNSIICEKRAIEQSVEYGHSVERELGFLCANVMLHLFGYDHMIEEDKIEMRTLEEKILNEIGISR